MSNISPIINLVFHLFMIFIMVYSSFAIFSLIRYGKSQVLGFIISVIYIVFMSGLYFQTLFIIKGL